MAPALLPFIVSSAVFALQHLQTTAAAVTKRVQDFHDANEPCDDSFPMAPTSSLLLLRQRPAAATTDSTPTLKVAIPSDPTRRSYAPLCADGRRIDVRRLEQCPGGSCYSLALDGCFHVTSRECTHPVEMPPATAEIPPPAPAAVEIPPPAPPAEAPPARTVETVHPVKLILKDMPRGYRPPPEVRSMILQLVTVALEEGLADELELIEVEYAGRLPPEDRGMYAKDVRKRFEDVPLPLRVTVRGPADMSDVAFVIATIRNRVDELSDRLRKYGESLDRNVFLNAELSTETYEFDEVLTAPTETPSSVVATAGPTRVPTSGSLEVSSNGVSTATAAEILDVAVEETAKVPWWAWLIIVLLILLLCICGVCCCIRRRRQNAEKDKQQVNIWLQNGNSAEPKGTRRKPPPQQRRPQPRRVYLRDEGERPSGRRHPPRPRQVRPAIKRHLSQTELEEEARQAREQMEPEEEMLHERGYRDPNHPSNALAVCAVPFEPPNRRQHPEFDQSLFTEGSMLDPPEENALVPYNPNSGQRPEDDRSYDSEEPEGFKTPKTESMFASDVRLEMSNTSRLSEMSKSEEPDGAKVPKQLSIFASDAYHLSPVVSGDDGHRKPRRVKRAPKKDAMFRCSWEELPEEVKTMSRSRMEREEGKYNSRSRAERDGHGQSEKKKNRKHKKKHRIAPRNSRGGGDIENGEGRSSSHRGGKFMRRSLTNLIVRAPHEVEDHDQSIGIDDL